jgi:selenocysteine lyase/cysteine desulfurase
VGAAPDEVAVTTSLSQGVSALASGLLLDGERRRIVVTDYEFPTIGQIWHAQERRWAEVVHVRSPLELEEFDRLVDDRTALVSVTHVCYRNGARLDVGEVVRLAHERGAHVLLDAYQSIGSLPIDVRALGVDFLACGALKYLLASAGLGFLWCRRELVDAVVPTQTGWFADRDIFEMDVSDYSPAPDARRFESGTPPVPSLYAGVAGIELMREIGIEETERHVRALNEELVAGVEERGGRVVTPRDRGALVCIASSAADALVAALAEDGIVTSARAGNLRVSLHAYNNRADVAAVLAALGRYRHLLA